ncbi:hypothetical protein PF005_g33733 [Phytophthora fragariae]|uniref:Secreted protein n=1 Tax=Phytophthora fragariae TaxID=53985 RepID=A0A6A3DIT6_9STRA|nr:hypothetical protein PF009_g28407 [Phytophthora fragariae]KAE9143575.1 hypothetical protein PF005_g33733 [Phytophthora fragariae]KAE9179611.1 hypothetical protein PF002_g27775 [Phytophthora fragariae]
MPLTLNFLVGLLTILSSTCCWCCRWRSCSTTGTLLERVRDAAGGPSHSSVADPHRPHRAGGCHQPRRLRRAFEAWTWSSRRCCRRSARTWRTSMRSWLRCGLSR